MADKNYKAAQRDYDNREPDDTMTILEEREMERAVDRLIAAVQTAAWKLSTEEIEAWTKEIEG